MIINYIISLLLFFFILYQEVKLHNKRLNEGIKIRHKEEWFIRLVLLLPSIIMLSLPYKNRHDFTPEWFAISIAIKLLLAGGFLAFLWWELFDGFYNVKRKKPWRFIGTIENDESSTDNFLRKFSTKMQGIVKIGLIILSFGLLVLSKFIL